MDGARRSPVALKKTEYVERKPAIKLRDSPTKLSRPPVYPGVELPVSWMLRDIQMIYTIRKLSAFGT
ncbi:unnamed protein product [Pleuronectes platessa]|uniref:Uncharacterized protein n=1 Tax=Pleuronectes platessa TaxID=8262 RepID=A0A9N7UYE9_PLEPL|nr:unnamed protein product [Pleuronectes platessa]